MDLVKHPPSLPPRPREGHKGLFGRVLVVGGNVDMIGAPALSGRAALRTGSGLVQIAMPRAVLATALTICPELIGLGLAAGANAKTLGDAIAKADVGVVGPGMGQSREANERLKLLIQAGKPLVIDADALNLLSLGKRWPTKFVSPAVLTPHPGEMKRLGALIGIERVPSDDAGRLDVARRAAKAFGQVLVLKGANTVVAAPDGRAFVNATGDSSLSKAGTGDVLAGMIASFIGQKLERFEAACLGVHLHGRAGELAGERSNSRSVLASDVIETIPAALSEYEAKTR
ncbi:MAG: NAD(P)H-hydrate dehydratase [Tepidisphaeraceae bacterium]